MDWIHCNTCGIQPSANVADIFRLTSCGHIFCQYCEKEGGIEECKICRNKEVTTIRLSSEMKQEIQVYFQDPEILASQLLKVIEFQKGHRMRFIQFLQSKVQKYNLAKMHIAKLEERVKRDEEHDKPL
ncbi:nenya [Lycorma delicatula]|uniref:nenya n=1 Tax=Lycorma delicatula TaxID=130591 RepID=UPI003F51A131